jgi:hypothetical protein
MKCVVTMQEGLELLEAWFSRQHPTAVTDRLSLTDRTAEKY